MTDRQIDIDAIRDRAKSSSPGPWFWYGHQETKTLDLLHSLSGHVAEVVMTFCRWGFQGAQPVFRDTDRTLIAADKLPIYQVAPDATDKNDPRVYRQTLIGIRHPDAEFIAHSRQDVDDLLAYIDQLESELEHAKAVTA